MCDAILDVILNELMRKNPKSCVVYEMQQKLEMKRVESVEILDSNTFYIGFSK